MIEIEKVHKSFGQLEVLKGIDLTVAKGEVLTIIGGSGSGKSTLLTCINGLETIDAGRIVVDGTEPRIDQILQVAVSIRTQHVASEAVLKLLSANTGSGNYNSGALGDPHELCLINFTNADPFSVRFAWDAVVIGLYATGTPAYTSDAFWKYSINGGTAVTGRVAPTGGTGDPDVPTSCSAFSEITLAAGDAIAFQLMALASTNDNAFWSGAALRATVHKKS